MTSSFLFIILILISTTSCNVNVEYLRGVPRLNNRLYMDYYFYCNAVGMTLIWEIDQFGLGGFRSTEVGRVIVDQRSNFNYTATLLSSKRTPERQLFDSVLIVSILGTATFNVTCRNGSVLHSRTIDNTNNGLGVESIINSSSVIEEYILTDTIVKKDDFSETSIFLCGVLNSIMYWRTSSRTIVFNINDAIGTSKPTPESGSVTVSQQAILIAHEPYVIVSVLFITDTSDVNVTCGYSVRDEVFLMSKNRHPTTSEDTTVSETTSSTISNTSMGVGGTTSLKVNHVEIIVPIIISIVVVAVIAVIIFIILVYCALKKKKRNPVNGSTNKTYEFQANETGTGVEDEPSKDTVNSETATGTGSVSSTPTDAGNSG